FLNITRVELCRKKWLSSIRFRCYSTLDYRAYLKANKMYVQGEEKAKLLNKIMTRKVINLEEAYECPPYYKLLYCARYCMQYSIKRCPLQYTCALNNACKLKLAKFTWCRKHYNYNSRASIPSHRQTIFARMNSLNII
ncbi:hypothetical protein TSAR_007779, partial [Trichomalopsis sarcophagae]